MKKSEFRFNKKRKHPSYIFKEKDNKYHSILITHAKKTSKRKNVQLYENPEPNNSSVAYVVPKVYVDDINSYNKKTYQNWKFHKFDKRKIKNIRKGK